MASVKGGPRRELLALGCDLSSYIGTHPMAGKERSGPLAATADLFEGRPWVLTPDPRHRHRGAQPGARTGRARAGPCRSSWTPTPTTAAVALVSHTPQLVSSMVAARLEEADETAVRLCGQGIRDVTRIAASDPGMWVEILSANPGPVADVLAGIAADLDETVRALRSLESADEDKRRDGHRRHRGRAAARQRGPRRGCPASTGRAPATYEIVAVLLSDEPGGLARLFADAGRAGVNIEDVRIEHATGQQAGLVQLMVEPAAAPGLTAALRERGWSIRQ